MSSPRPALLMGGVEPGCVAAGWALNIQNRGELECLSWAHDFLSFDSLLVSGGVLVLGRRTA